MAALGASRCRLGAVLALLWLLVAMGVGVGAATTQCNQHEELCARAYNEVTYISTHASFAVTNQTQPTRPGTQFRGIREQLDDGVRGLHLNLKQPTAVVSLCYPTCDVNNGGPLVDTLRVVKEWLDANRNDVVTLFLEGTSADATPDAVARAFADSGIDKYALRGKPAAWPTLGAMIGNGTTLVVFAEDAAIAAESPQGYIIPYRGTVLRLDGPFAYGAPWTCGPWTRTSESIMLIPHYIVQTASYNGVAYANMPYPFHLGTTNGYQFEFHAVNCRASQSIWINFMEVDFYDQGDVKTPTLKLNSLPYPGDSPDNFYPEFYDADPDLPAPARSAAPAIRLCARPDCLLLLPLLLLPLLLPAAAALGRT